MKASQKYKKGKWTSCSFKTLSDGVQVISIYDPKSKSRKHLSFKVKNLNKQNEQILEDADE